jgi:hypothetical protein
VPVLGLTVVLRTRKRKTFSSRRTAVPGASGASTTASADVPARSQVFKPVTPRKIGASDNFAGDGEIRWIVRL